MRARTGCRGRDSRKRAQRSQKKTVRKISRWPILVRLESSPSSSQIIPIFFLRSLRSFAAIKVGLQSEFPLQKLRVVRKAKPSLEESPSVELFIGQRIRNLRLQRNVTLDQLAERVRLTKGQLSKIENGLVSSPVSTLTRIASALGVGPGYFFQVDGSERRAVLIRKNERKVIVGRGSKLGHYYQSLAFGLPFEKDFEPYLMNIEERKIDPTENIFRHPGHELLFMLEGEMDYRHDDQIYHLSPGDSLFFDGAIEHGPVMVYSPPVRFLSIISNSKGAP